MKKKQYIEFEDGSAVLKKERKIGRKELAVSIAAALLLFICLIVIESRLLSKYDKSTVVTAKCTISRSQEITDANVDQFFEEKEVPVNLMPDCAVQDKQTLVNKIVSEKINRGEMVIDDCFRDEEKYLSKMQDPLEIGISVSNASNIAGGTIRKGDFINIYVVDSTTKQSVEVLHQAYVCKAFNKDGVEITEGGGSELCLDVVIYIDSIQEQYVNEKINHGTIYISKVLNYEGN